MDALATRGMRDKRRPWHWRPIPALRAEAERLRGERHAELREALGVLTPDQQATAWEIPFQAPPTGTRYGILEYQVLPR